MTEPTAAPRSIFYADGTAPKRGDTIEYADQSRFNRGVNPEAAEVWIVTSVCQDMVRAKCHGKPVWRQAFYTELMNPVTFAK